jgi:hypothetical protein
MHVVIIYCNSANDKRLPHDTVLSNGSSLDSLSTATGMCECVCVWREGGCIAPQTLHLGIRW